jgi:hypothetical protein
MTANDFILQHVHLQPSARKEKEGGLKSEVQHLAIR